MLKTISLHGVPAADNQCDRYLVAAESRNKLLSYNAVLEVLLVIDPDDGSTLALDKTLIPSARTISVADIENENGGSAAPEVPPVPA